MNAKGICAMTNISSSCCGSTQGHGAYPALHPPEGGYSFHTKIALTMFRRFILWSLVGLTTALSGQSISPSLLGSAGAHASNASFGTLDWSVGETVVSTLNPTPGSSPVLTQGFHQVFVNAITPVEDAESDAFAPLVYPNPSREWVQVESPEPVQVRLLDLLGVALIPYGERSTFHNLALRDIPSGTYLLEIARGDNKPGKFFKLQIIQ